MPRTAPSPAISLYAVHREESKLTTDRRIVRSIRRVPTQVKSYGKAETVLDMPYLIQMSRDSYQRFLNTSLRDLFDEISPIDDFTGGRMELRFGEYRFEEPEVLRDVSARDRELHLRRADACRASSSW